MLQSAGLSLQVLSVLTVLQVSSATAMVLFLVLALQWMEGSYTLPNLQCQQCSMAILPSSPTPKGLLRMCLPDGQPQTEQPRAVLP